MKYTLFESVKWFLNRVEYIKPLPNFRTFLSPPKDGIHPPAVAPHSLFLQPAATTHLFCPWICLF